MDDQELTKWAAKAAGLWDAENDCVAIPWLPLVNDGDALRLAAKLRIDIEWQNVGAFPEPCVEAYHREGDHGYFCASEHEKDYRRAIVRAAAAIGQAMGDDG